MNASLLDNDNSYKTSIAPAYLFMTASILKDEAEASAAEGT